MKRFVPIRGLRPSLGPMRLCARHTAPIRSTAAGFISRTMTTCGCISKRQRRPPRKIDPRRLPTISHTTVRSRLRTEIILSGSASSDCCLCTSIEERPMPNDYSPQELMVVVLARDLKDSEVLRVGVAMPVVEAAVRLAHLMHGPNMELIFFGARMNVAHLHMLPMPAFGWDRRVVRWAESYSDTGHRFNRVKDWHNHVFFIGGVQVDPYGNTNLIGVGPDYHHLRFRGPGSVGTATLSTHVGRYYIVFNSHTPRIFVERC